MAKDNRVIVSRVGHIDTERLNFCEKKMVSLGLSKKGVRIIFCDDNYDHHSLSISTKKLDYRQAIDLAMEEEKTTDA